MQGTNMVGITEQCALLEKFKERASKGEVVSAQEIKAEFDKKRGKDTGSGYIYMLLGGTCVPSGKNIASYKKSLSK